MMNASLRYSFLRMKPACLWLLAACTLSYVGGLNAAEADAITSNLTEQEMKRGRILFLQCSACHTLTPEDNGGKIGPSLANVFGREAGAAEYFTTYSSALKTSGYVWNRETMDLWLLNPTAMVPGTSMVFGGISDEAQRELLIRYLEIETQP